MRRGSDTCPNGPEASQRTPSVVRDGFAGRARPDRGVATRPSRPAAQSTAQAECPVEKPTIRVAPPEPARTPPARAVRPARADT
eukprot:12783638-Alexandrium_andersonii.AAC.1